MFSLMGVCDIKPMDGKTSQMTLWESDQFIVPRKAAGKKHNQSDSSMEI
jgi:hypothetical protein